ncbi:dTMP kinase [uncultured Kocuria sp.]|mgnify:FL=1|uniref:dTMP kinase n=1 Tax=uncultured Kocuria sp. TaxID=259305 RepID=UPI0025999BF3|nr:dTMP kinase [uncultured Kocuria sp.]MCT1368481.1 dTMP kinase [Rothia sp. p3-SID1597]
MTSTLSYSRDSPAPQRPGTFIVFEGGDGSGKSTQARLLRDRLLELDRPVTLTREPGGTDIGERIRALVLDHGQGEIDAHTEALLYAASRAAHAHQLIAPKLDAGRIVICDRYIDSSAAYQGAGRGLGEENITNLSRWATEELLPDITVVLSVDVADARRRMADRGAADRLESEPDEFHLKVQESFRSLTSDATSGRIRVDGTGEPHEVAARVWEAVAPVLREEGTR